MRVARQLQAGTGRTMSLTAPLWVDLRARQRITAEAVNGLKFAECLPRQRATEVVARLADLRRWQRATPSE